MNTKSIYTGSTILFSSLMAGCVYTQQPLTGTFFTDASSGQVATSNAGSSKKGVACATGILGIVSGDSSIETAMKNAGITTVSFVDKKYTNVFLVYAKDCTIVTGE